MMSAVRLPMVAASAARASSRGRRAGNTATAALASSSSSSSNGGTYGGGVPTFLSDPNFDLQQHLHQPRRHRRRRRRRQADTRARSYVSSRPRNATSVAAASAADASTASTITTTNNADDDESDRHFHELPVRVYIEHTDAYQVVYHANYFKFLWRGREALLFGDPAAVEAQGSSPWDTVCVVAIDNCKFARSAVLGDDVTVHTRVVAAGRRTVTMRQEVVDADDGSLKLSADVVVAPLKPNGSPVEEIPDTFRAFHGLPPQLTPVVVVGEGGGGGGGMNDDDDDDLYDVSSSSSSSSSSTPTPTTTATATAATALLDTEVTLFEEELSVGGRLGRGASEADVLRWFERNRTEAIGGADALAALKEREGVIVVVSGMTAGRFAAKGLGFLMSGCGAGDEAGTRTRTRMLRATVRSTVELRRRNLQVVFKQRLLVPLNNIIHAVGSEVEVKGGEERGEADDEDDTSTTVTVAAAEVTCTCLSRDTGRPVPCPPGLLETFASLSLRSTEGLR